MLQVKLKVKEEELVCVKGREQFGVKDGDVAMPEEASDQDGEEEDEEEQYTVEKILEKQEDDNGKLLYKVKWQGYSYEECTWEPLENLADHTGTCVHLERFEHLRSNADLKFETEKYVSKLEEEELDYEHFENNFIQDMKSNQKTTSSKKLKIPKYIDEEYNDEFNETFRCKEEVEKKRIKKTRARLEREGVQFEPEEIYNCNFCGKICKSVTGLHIHQNKKCKENPSKNAQCHLCNTVTNSPDDLKKHMKSVHNNEKDETEVIGRCKFCNMELQNIKLREDNNEFAGKVISQRHQKLCLKKIMKTLKCSHCPVEAPSKDMLLEHMKSCHKITPPPWPCLMPDCEQVSVTQNARRSHMLIRHGIRIKDARCKRIMNITCRFCLIPNYFLSESECKEHEEQWHKFNCSEEGCDFTCKSGQLLQDHEVKIHKLEIPIEAKLFPDKSVCCDQCGKRLKNKTYLQDHLETHEKKELMCDKCDRVFATSVNLRAHQRIMHKNTKLECQYCGQFFTNSRNLWHHNRQYHEEKKWQCKLCGKSFVCQSKMEEHNVAVHTKTATFICSHGCGKAYNDNPNRRAHERSVHEGKPRRPKMNAAFDGSQGSLGVM